MDRRTLPALVLALTLPSMAHAEDGPSLWVKPSFAVAYGPLGLLGDVKIQARTPLHRSDSIVFRSTYAGVGGRVAITPAFVDAGPRFSLAPIDVFDVDVQLGVQGFWPGSSGLLPYATTSGTLDAQREARKADARPGAILYASVAPTFKIKLGPIIAFTSADFAFLHLIDASAARPFVYEAYRDMVIAPDDVVLTSFTGVLGEILDGKKTAVLLRAGALLRHRQAFVSQDVSTAVGGAVSVRPGRKPGWPTVLLAVLGYVRDVDRALGAPNVQLQVSWELEKALPGKRDAMSGGAL